MHSAKLGNFFSRLVAYSGFQEIAESNSRLLWCCFSVLCDWLAEHASLSQLTNEKQH